MGLLLSALPPPAAAELESAAAGTRPGHAPAGGLPSVSAAEGGTHDNARAGGATAGAWGPWASAGRRAGRDQYSLRKRGLAPSEVRLQRTRPSRAPAPRRLEHRGFAAFNPP